MDSSNERGVTLEEIEQTMAEGWEAADAKPGTQGRWSGQGGRSSV